MKRVISILLSLMILLSGIHLTVASHICCGELAAVKWSVTGAKASCGMEDQSAPCPGTGALDTDCCKNHVSKCSSDENYFPSTPKAEKITVCKAPLFIATNSFNHSVPVSVKIAHSMVGPPVPSDWNEVDQSLICVFII